MDSIEYYNKYAAKIYEDTVDVDMSEILNKFLSLLNEGDTILYPYIRYNIKNLIAYADWTVCPP